MRRDSAVFEPRWVWAGAKRPPPSPERRGDVDLEDLGLAQDHPDIRLAVVVEVRQRELVGAGAADHRRSEREAAVVRNDAHALGQRGHQVETAVAVHVRARHAAGEAGARGQRGGEGEGLVPVVAEHEDARLRHAGATLLLGQDHVAIAVPVQVERIDRALAAGAHRLHDRRRRTCRRRC